MTNRPDGLGAHLLVDLYGCPGELLNDLERLQEVTLRACREAGATVLDSTFRSFEPQGVSGIVLVAESHFSFHAWPEHGYLALDFFTCGQTVQPRRAMEIFIDAFQPARWESSLHARGQALATPLDKAGRPPLFNSRP